MTRTQVSRKVPVARKGTKYVARANSFYNECVPVIVAVRDMLKLAKTSKDVQHMINERILKLNGKIVKDLRESVRIFNTLEADKTYKLTILSTGRFELEETKEKSRLCKVVGKKLAGKKEIQLCLHDGTNILASDFKIGIGDSIELGFDGKVQKIISLEKGKNFFVISGRNVGSSGKIVSVEGKKVKVIIENRNKEVELDESHIIIR